MNAHTLKLIRQTVGLSQRQLASRAGVSNGLVSFIESGRKRLTPDVKRRLLTVLGVTDEQVQRFEELSRELEAV